MTNDYSYCNESSCIHRIGCKRFIQNHILNFTPTRWINGKNCINSEPYPYALLDRFRNSNGTKLKDK